MMPDDLAREVVGRAVWDCTADLEATFVPGSFVRWVRDNRLELLRELGEAGLKALAAPLMPTVRRA